MPLPEKKASRIKSVRKFDIQDKDNWEEAFDWFVEQTIKYYDLFSNF